MWETLDFTVKYIISEAGVFGALFVLLLSFVGIKEFFAHQKRNEKQKELPDNDSNMSLLLKRQEDEIKLLGKHSTKLNEVEKKIQEMSGLFSNFSEINKMNSEINQKLTEQMKDANDDRIDELKELLEKYNTTMTDLSLTLEKIKFVLKTKFNGE